MDELFFFVSSIIDKLPYSWIEVKKTIKHKEEDLNIKQLGTHLKIKVSIRTHERGEPKNLNISSINMVEESPYQKGKRKSHQRNSSKKRKVAKSTQPNKSCWICG